MLKFKDKLQKITCENEIGDYKIEYRFQFKDGGIIGDLEGIANTSDGRHVKNMSTSDAVNFYGNTNENVEDDLSGLHNQMKADLIELFTNTIDFVGE